MISKILLLVAAVSPAVHAAEAISIAGAVRQTARIDAAFTRGLPLHRRMVKVAGANGKYRATLEVEGYALRDLLDRAEIQKTDDGFSRPLDTFFVATGRQDARALFSYGEVFFTDHTGPLLAERARLILPHHHEAIEAGDNDQDNDPTALRSVVERDRIDLRKCASCHAGPEPTALFLPKGVLLVTPDDGFGGRFVEDVAGIAVRQTGITVKDNRDNSKSALVNEPALVSLDGKRTALTADRYRQLPRRAWSDATFGMGMGFHGEHSWEGVDFGGLLRPLVANGAEVRNLWVLVTAEDGYRSLFSGAEVFAAPEGRGLLMADRADGKLFGPGSGRYHVVAKGDFYIDRSVRMVKEIRIGSIAPVAPRARQ